VGGQSGVCAASSLPAGRGGEEEWRCDALLHRLEVIPIFSAAGCMVVAVSSLSGRHGGRSKVVGSTLFFMALQASCWSCSPAAYRRQVSAIPPNSKDAGHPLPAPSNAQSWLSPTALAQVGPFLAPVR
jgi:hypothetical protein